MNSLTDDAQKQVRTRGNLLPFRCGGKGSGPVLLKVIMMLSHVDTRNTRITSVTTKLSNLDHAMHEQDSDIVHLMIISLVWIVSFMPEESKLKISWSTFSRVTRLARMLNLWNTSRRRKISMTKVVKETTNNSWIGLVSTSSKPGKNQSTGVRELVVQKTYKPKSTP
jgi:hypothetical protein